MEILHKGEYESKHETWDISSYLVKKKKQTETLYTRRKRLLMKLNFGNLLK